MIDDVEKKIERFIEFPDAAIMFVQDDNENILFIEQYRVHHGINTLELPGGNIEINETAEEASIREFHEETGLSCKSVKHLLTIDMDFSISKHQIYIFEGNIDNTKNRKKGEFNIKKIHINKIFELIKLGEITHSPSICAIFYMMLEGVTNDSRIFH